MHPPRRCAFCTGTPPEEPTPQTTQATGLDGTGVRCTGWNTLFAHLSQPPQPLPCQPSHLPLVCRPLHPQGGSSRTHLEYQRLPRMHHTAFQWSLEGPLCLPHWSPPPAREGGGPGSRATEHHSAVFFRHDSTRHPIRYKIPALELLGHYTNHHPCTWDRAHAHWRNLSTSPAAVLCNVEEVE